MCLKKFWDQKKTIVSKFPFIFHGNNVNMGKLIPYKKVVK